MTWKAPLLFSLLCMCACLPCVAHVLVWFDLVTFFALLLPWCATCIHELESVIISIIIIIIIIYYYYCYYAYMHWCD